MRTLQTMALATAMLMATARAGLCDGTIYFTGSMLIEMCSAEDRAKYDLQATNEFGRCLGFIVGISDASQCGDPTWGFAAKLPTGVTSGQAVKIATKYLNEHLEELHLAAASLVAKALQDAFPCP
jgi:hypothetical protein